MIRLIKEFLFGNSCKVYIACKMTGRDRAEMVHRAQFVSKVLEDVGVTPISPVVEEGVKNEPGKLVNSDKERLREFWKRDKFIIRKLAHVVLIDHGEMKSFGMEREYMLNRGVLWKPTVLVIAQGTPISVAEFEDDAVFYSVHSAARHIQTMWGSRWNRWCWRAKMLNKSLIGWFVDQAFAWR